MINNLKYILIDKTTLSVTLGSGRSSSAFTVPTKFPDSRLLSPLESAVYYDILYRAVNAEDRRQGIEAAYWLVEPDPWLISIAYIMWEGIIQGMAWDAAKVLVQNALTILRSHDLAPSQPLSIAGRSSKEKNVESELELGFSWHEYANDGRKKYQMFIGLKRVYNKSTKAEKESISEAEAEAEAES